jgi:hypothetical protein
MAVNLQIEYDKLVELVDQLNEDQQRELVVHVLTQRSRQRVLTTEEKIQLLDAAKLTNAIREEPSIRRTDWYGDDGR